MAEIITFDPPNRNRLPKPPPGSGALGDWRLDVARDALFCIAVGDAKGLVDARRIASEALVDIDEDGTGQEGIKRDRP